MKNIIYILIFLISLPVLGQEVIELPMQSNKVVVKLRFKNGSIVDPQGKEGLTNLTATVFANTGSDRYTKSEIDDKLYPMAAGYGSFTDKEVTTITFEVHKDWLNEFYDIFSGLLLNPSFAEKDFERIKSNILVSVSEVIKMSSDEDFSKYALEEQLFKGSRYSHLKMGTVEGLNAITREDVVNHWNQYFTRNNVIIGIAGDYTQDFLNTLKADVSKLSGNNPQIPEVPAPEMPDGIQVQLVPKPNNLGTAIYTGYPLAIDRSSDDWAALAVVNSYLGEHRKSYSKLYQLIRQARSMNYGDYTYIEWYEGGGSNQLPLTGFPRNHNYFAIWIRPVQTAFSLKSQYPELSDIEVGHAHFALRMALFEIERVKNEGLTQEEFDLTRQFLRSYSKLYAQTPNKQLGFRMDSRFYGLDDYLIHLDQKLSELTLEDVNNAAKKYLQTQNMYITMITDAGEAEALKKALLENKPSPMTYSKLVQESLSQEVFDLDKKVENYNINVKNVIITPPKDIFIKSE